MSVWRQGVWTEGRWIVNNGQDASKVFHTFEIQGRPTSWRHAFAPYKKPGDYWINPETENGIPLVNGGLKVVRSGELLVIDELSTEPGAYYNLVEGIMEAPAYNGPLFDFASPPLETVGQDADRALAGYFRNTFYFRNDAGQIIEVIYYNADHTSKAWRDGKWVNGIFLLNNGQDNSCLIQSRGDMFNHYAGWCHPFAPFKKPGDVWVAPESHLNGDPVYPLTRAGIPVVTVDGENVIAGTDMIPREFYRIERGIIPLEELQSRAF